jgi:hypothetical protein
MKEQKQHERNLREVIQPLIKKRLAEFELHHKLTDEERATARVVISAMIFKERLRKAVKEKLLQLIILN